jgi:hypothetical protein
MTGFQLRESEKADPDRLSGFLEAIESNMHRLLIDAQFMGETGNIL